MKRKLRLLQTGDIHIGRGRSSWGAKKAIERGERLLDTLYEVAHEQKCQGILICGDVFDAKDVTPEERELVSRKFAQLTENMPTFITGGNHDLKSKKHSNLHFLAEITENSNEIPNLHVGFSTHESIWEAPTGKKRPGGLYILGASCPLSEDQAWIESCVSSLPDGQFIFMGHGTIHGCIRQDSGWAPDEEEDHGLSLAKASESDQVLWWAFGDIHKRQKLPTLAPGARGWYAGSPIQMNFGEDPDRGVLVLTFVWDEETKWAFRGKKYVRIDDRGFAPLLTVTAEEDINALPENALVRLAKGLVLPTERHSQIVSTISVVDDRSTPEIKDESVPEGGQLEVFDPSIADIADVEQQVLSGLDKDDRLTMSEAKYLIGEAINRFKERTFVS